MGQTLSEPIREKHSSSDSDARLLYAASAMQGWRISMEDAHTTKLELGNKKGHSFFAVYDGHGGQNVAKYSGIHLHDRIAESEQFNKKKYPEAIKEGFLGTDEDLKKDPKYANDPSGCTAVIALVTPDNKIYVGNAGDSRAVLSVRGEAKPMSEDHKPVNKEEQARITKAGGFVEFGRVNGNLALSRAIGDFEFKQNENLPPDEQIVTAMPEIKEETMTTETEFLVLACDGIWDCLTSQDVVAFIRQEISTGNDLKTACENLMEQCLARDSELGGIGCDNMTVVIVAFLHGRTPKEWHDWIKQRVEQKIGPAFEKEKVVIQPPNNASEYSQLDLNEEIVEDDLDITADANPNPDDFNIGLEDSDAAQQNSFSIDTPPRKQHSRHNSGSNSRSSSRSSSTDSGLVINSPSRSSSTDSGPSIDFDNETDDKKIGPQEKSDATTTTTANDITTIATTETEKNLSTLSSPVKVATNNEIPITAAAANQTTTGNNKYNTYPQGNRDMK
ncbi:6714_t:CDS:2 [Ambispora leptoticha]|uniref:protein-serine/threonine phosphatase n=1 Tax=Ambispora leptoticha TaxID=144679 RepID=A0A9N8YRJ8_9GLOM|nr:6714_t:CDS:2 [Ambispora leptoticha]